MFFYPPGLKSSEYNYDNYFILIIIIKIVHGIYIVVCHESIYCSPLEMVKMIKHLIVLSRLNLEHV